jgi:hypothetical protein
MMRFGATLPPRLSHSKPHHDHALAGAQEASGLCREDSW